MQIYHNQDSRSARQLGFSSNICFASDKTMSPNGIDITPVRKKGEEAAYQYEVTEYDENTKLAKIMVMNPKEYKKYVSKPRRT